LGAWSGPAELMVNWNHYFTTVLVVEKVFYVSQANSRPFLLSTALWLSAFS
jgi:hypothetical protein